MLEQEREMARRNNDLDLFLKMNCILAVADGRLQKEVAEMVTSQKGRADHHSFVANVRLTCAGQFFLGLKAENARQIEKNMF